MTTEEKLQHFYDISMESARDESAKAIETYQEALTQLLSEHKEEKQRNAGNQLRLEAENAKRETNKALSAEQLHIKRRLSKKQQELRETLFADVEKKLIDFRNTDQYLDWMEDKIKEALEIASGEETEIYLTPEDEDKLEMIASRTGAVLHLAKSSFLGGIDAIIPSKNIMIDHTFKSIFETQKEEFKFDGGLLHE